jgi:hypothetical protein
MEAQAGPPVLPADREVARRAEGRRLARARARVRRARARRIRRRLVALSATLFVAAWLAIFARLASGHDPALAQKRSTATTSGQKATTTAPSTGSSTDQSSSSQPSGSDPSSSPSPVTSSQS